MLKKIFARQPSTKLDVGIAIIGVIFALWQMGVIINEYNENKESQ